MTRITIHSVNNFFDALEWCEENLNHNDWTLPAMNWPSERYDIDFTDPTIATMFALKWVA